MSIKPYYEHQGITIYHGDCREILPELSRFDLLLTDPPYGINYVPYQRNAVQRDQIMGDDKEFDPSHLLNLECSHKVIWGGNNFANQLPIGGWLCWDKRTNESADRCLGSPIELAWTSKKTLFAIARIMHGGVVNADGFNVRRVHPTQKPIKLMTWCLSFFPKANQILDPYMGSGTTLLAAKLHGLTAVGIEMSEKYCEIAAMRLSQDSIFYEEPSVAV